MSSTTTSSSNIRLILSALTEYTNQTGIDLTKNPFAEKLQNCDSAKAITGLLQERANAFKEFRDGNRKLINCLSPIVQLLQTFSGTLGQALVLVSHGGSIRF
jgi:fungal STAND N-terminal Goodbye domain